MTGFIESLIGPDKHELEWWQMGARAFIVFFVALILLRANSMRAFGRNTAFDVLLSILLGAVLGRTITGGSAFFPTIFASLVLVVLHKLLSWLSCKSQVFGKFVKGEPELLWDGKEIVWKNMRRNNISRDDLIESVREEANVAGLEEVGEAYFERSGKISIIKK